MSVGERDTRRERWEGKQWEHDREKVKTEGKDLRWKEEEVVLEMGDCGRAEGLSKGKQKRGIWGEAGAEKEKGTGEWNSG